MLSNGDVSHLENFHPKALRSHDEPFFSNILWKSKTSPKNKVFFLIVLCSMVYFGISFYNFFWITLAPNFRVKNFFSYYLIGDAYNNVGFIVL